MSMPSVDPGDMSADDMYSREPIPQADGVAPKPNNVCPGCGIPFRRESVRDRKAEGFEQCIDCMIADGREGDLSMADLDDLTEARLTARYDFE